MKKEFELLIYFNLMHIRYTILMVVLCCVYIFVLLEKIFKWQEILLEKYLA